MMSGGSRKKIWTIVAAVIIVAAGVAIIALERQAQAPAQGTASAAASLATSSTSAVPSAAPPTWQGSLYYTTPSALMSGGDFSFTYPSGYVLKEDTVKADRHEVILASRDGSQTLEVNVSGCTAYTTCKVVSGVPIGTNASGSAVQKLFDTVVGSFVVQPAK